MDAIRLAEALRRQLAPATMFLTNFPPPPALMVERVPIATAADLWAAIQQRWGARVTHLVRAGAGFGPPAEVVRPGETWSVVVEAAGPEARFPVGWLNGPLTLPDALTTPPR